MSKNISVSSRVKSSVGQHHSGMQKSMERSTYLCANGGERGKGALVERLGESSR